MRERFLYYLGGPADLRKEAFDGGRYSVGDEILVAEAPSMRLFNSPPSKTMRTIEIHNHVYSIRQVSERDFVAIWQGRQ